MRRGLFLLAIQLVVVCALLSPAYGQGTASVKASGAKVSLPTAPSVPLTLPLKDGSVRLAIIGDTGTASKQQQEIADLMVKYRSAFPFDTVLMMGDNLYGGETPADYKKKFQDVYQVLLDNKVKFYASLGNHDQPNERFYEYFNMNGKEYYRFTKGNAAFYALNSTYMDKTQLKWLEDELAKDTSDWKICFFHHPPYSSGAKHGSDKQLREVLEPLFVKYGVNVVLTGHDHFYERIKPQKGIYYFVSGAAGKLREGNVKTGSVLTAKAYDADMSFMLAEIAKDELHFQVISRTGETVDSGVIMNQKKKM